MHLDLACLAVRAFICGSVHGKFKRLNVLVENAGVMTQKRELTADGLEMNFGVNHVGHFLLTELLLPLLKTSAPSRIVVVSSNMHASGKIDFDDIAMEKTWSGLVSPVEAREHALRSRAVEASRRHRGRGERTHPGVIATDLARDYPAPIRLMAKWFFKSPEQGARTSLYLATAPEAAGISGRCFVDAKEKKPGSQALDEALAERLWAVGGSSFSSPAPGPAGVPERQPQNDRNPSSPTRIGPWCRDQPRASFVQADCNLRPFDGEHIFTL